MQTTPCAACAGTGDTTSGKLLCTPCNGSGRKTKPEPGDLGYVKSWKYDHVHTKVQVVKVTPTGRIQVKPILQGGADKGELGTETWTFEAAPRRLMQHDAWGKCSLSNHQYLDLDVAAVDEASALHRRTVEAAHALNAVRTEHVARPTWGKGPMLEELARLEALVAAARRAVEAV